MSHPSALHPPIGLSGLTVLLGLVTGSLPAIAVVSAQPFGQTLPAEAVQLVTSKARYQRGEPVYFGVLNATNRPIGIEDHCPREPLDLYRFDGQRWRVVRETAEGISCQGRAKTIVIPPQTLRGASYEAWQRAVDQPGRYKLRVEIEGYRTVFE